MIRAVFLTVLTVVFFFVIWIYNPFVHKERYEVPPEHMKIINDTKTYAKEGKELFKAYCQACHSVRYDALYIASVEANPKLASLQEIYGKVLPRNIYEAVFKEDLDGLKASFGKVPPDLSTMYLVKGPEYLYNFTLYPDKILPGTSMPKVIDDPVQTAKIVSYLKSVAEPPPEEKNKRTLMGIGTISYFVVMGILFYLWWKREVKKMGL